MDDGLASSIRPLVLSEPVDGLHIVNLGHSFPVDRNVEPPFGEAKNGMHRHFKVDMLPVLPDQKW